MSRHAGPGIGRSTDGRTPYARDAEVNSYALSLGVVIMPIFDSGQLGIRIRAGEHATVQCDVVAGHEGRFVGRKPQDGFGDFDWFAEPAERMHREHAFIDLRVREGAVSHGGLNHCGANGVYANTKGS